MDCIYLAAGIGKRLKKEIPKQFLKLNGKPIFIYALEVLENIEWITNIYVTYNKNYKELYEKAISDYNITKTKLILGGATRQESVYQALKYIKTEKVIIHEAARPIIFPDFINSFLNYENEVAVVPTIPISFTVSEGGEYMTGILKREKLQNIQLPQMFDYKILYDAHKKAVQENFIATEDSLMIFKYGHKVRFIDGCENNLKITTPFDLIIAGQIIKGSIND